MSPREKEARWSRLLSSSSFSEEGEKEAEGCLQPCLSGLFGEAIMRVLECEAVQSHYFLGQTGVMTPEGAVVCRRSGSWSVAVRVRAWVSHTTLAVLFLPHVAALHYPSKCKGSTKERRRWGSVVGDRKECSRRGDLKTKHLNALCRQTDSNQLYKKPCWGQLGKSEP